MILTLGKNPLISLRELHTADPRHFDIQQDQIVEKGVVGYVIKQIAALGIGRSHSRSPAACRHS